MRRYKVVFTCVGKSAEIGPFSVYACAITDAQNPILTSAHVTAAEASFEAAWKKAAVTAFANLEKRIEKEHFITTFLSTESSFKDFHPQPGKKIFFMAPHSAPRECQQANELVLAHIQKRRELWALECPHLTGLSAAEILQRHGDIGIVDVQHPNVASVWQELTRKKKILLHICCGPDAAGVINQLKRDYEVLCFWYDPNIQPKDEYDKRLQAFEQVAAIEEVPYIVGEYDVDNFFASIKGLEHTPEQGAKCSVCYDMRLERSAVEAYKQGCDLFTTTLAISPHKVQEKLKNFGELSGKRHGVQYLARNFMKDEGFKKSVEYTEAYNIYRQDYCGCLYSLHEGGTAARAEAQKLGLTREALKAAALRTEQIEHHEGKHT